MLSLTNARRCSSANLYHLRRAQWIVIIMVLAITMKIMEWWPNAGATRALRTMGRSYAENVKIQCLLILIACRDTGWSCIISTTAKIWKLLCQLFCTKMPLKNKIRFIKMMKVCCIGIICTVLTTSNLKLLLKLSNQSISFRYQWILPCSVFSTILIILKWKQNSEF